MIEISPLAKEAHRKEMDALFHFRTRKKGVFIQEAINAAVEAKDKELKDHLNTKDQWITKIIKEYNAIVFDNNAEISRLQDELQEARRIIDSMRHELLF